MTLYRVDGELYFQASIRKSNTELLCSYMVNPICIFCSTCNEELAEDFVSVCFRDRPSFKKVEGVKVMGPLVLECMECKGRDLEVTWAKKYTKWRYLNTKAK